MWDVNQYSGFLLYRKDCRMVRFCEKVYLDSEIMEIKIVLSSLIFSRSNPFIFFKSPDKIAQIIKSISISNLCDRIIRSSQLITGLFDSLAVQVVHGSLVSHLREKSAEIFRRHGNRGWQLLKSNRVSIVFFNKLQNLF